jgi:hypothetical protein
MAYPRRKKSPARPAEEAATRAARERMLDQTLADSFPASDPPSSLPNPAGAEEERPEA